MVCYNVSIKAKEMTIMTKYMVKNDINNTAVVFTEFNKAQNTLEYLSKFTNLPWYMKIIEKKKKN